LNRFLYENLNNILIIYLRNNRCRFCCTGW